MTKETRQRDAAQTQHYVPKFILRNFMSDPDRNQVTVFDKQTGKIFQPNIKGVMAERRFNDFFVDDEWIATFEPGVGKIEEQVFPTYRRVVETRRLNRTDDERANLALLIAFQMVRTKGHRDLFTQMGDMLKEKWPEYEPEEHPFKTEEDALTAWHAKFLPEALQEMMPLIIEKDFILMEAPAGSSYYLGDNPVCMHNSEPKHPFYGNVGLALRGIEVYLPLARDLVLCAWCPSLMEKARSQLADHAKLKAALLGRLMQGQLTPDGLKAQMEYVDRKLVPVANLSEAFERGQPLAHPPEMLEFYNSLQMSSAVRHVICPQGNFDLARRFMKDFPAHRGRRMQAT